MQLAHRVDAIAPSSTLAITAKANALRAQGLDVIGLGAGEPDFNTPDHIIEAAMKAVKNGGTKYTPSGGIKELKEAIVLKFKKDQQLDFSPENIIVTSGAKHALYLAFQSLINPGDEVIIPTPYWVSYPEQVKLAGGIPVFIEGAEENGFKITPEQLERAVTAKTRALILNSPSNPTGMIYSEEELRAIAEVCLKHRLVVISDEIYEKLVYNGEKAVSIAQAAPELKAQTVIINGVSKSHAMTGWRIGYAAGDAALIRAMTNVASHSTSNPASVSQYAALEAYRGPQDAVEKMRQAFETRLNAAYERLIAIPGVRCQKPQGAFYLFPNVKQAVQSAGFASVTDWAAALLEEERVALVPGDGFGAPDFVRLSYATSMENINEALDRIHAFVERHMK
jgi:aspartate aminotransferase